LVQVPCAAHPLPFARWPARTTTHISRSVARRGESLVSNVDGRTLASDVELHCCTTQAQCGFATAGLDSTWMRKRHDAVHWRVLDDSLPALHMGVYVSSQPIMAISMQLSLRTLKGRQYGLAT
jgi:hypothetical protein